MMTNLKKSEIDYLTYSQPSCALEETPELYEKLYKELMKTLTPNSILGIKN